MSAKDYAALIYKTLRQPDPDEVDPGAYHDVGEWSALDALEAIEAVVTRRLGVVRGAGEAAEMLPASVQRVIQDADFLSFSEYLKSLRELETLKRALHRQQDQERRREHDGWHAPNKPHFYADIQTPNGLQTALVRNHDPDRHTPDRAGYLAYLEAAAPELATFFFGKLRALISEADRQMHTYITGSSGSGKSELMKVLISAYARQDTPPAMIIIDPHGKFADEVAAQEEVIAADRLVYVNPPLSRGLTPTLNPFELDDPDSANVVAAQLVGVLNELFQGAHHAGLTGNMDALLRPCLIALLRMPNTDLLTLQQLFMSKSTDPLYQQVLEQMPAQQRGFITSEWEKKRFEVTKDAIVAKIQTLMNADAFLNFLTGPSTLDLDALIKARKTVCFSLQKGELDSDTVSAIGSFIMAVLQGYVLRHYRHRQHHMVPIHVFVDECHNFLNPTVRHILAEARKFGLHLTLAQQYAGQEMDTELTKSVLANTAIKIAGFNDEKATQREMSRVMSLNEGELVGLEKRRFYMKSSEGRAVKVSPPSHLVDRRNCVSAERWAEELERQKERYYRPVGSEPEAPDHEDTEQPTGSKPAKGKRPGPPKPNLEFI